jgi:hypothetical protein
MYLTCILFVQFWILEQKARTAKEHRQQVRLKNLHTKQFRKVELETGEVGGGTILVVMISLQGWWWWLQSTWREKTAATQALKRAKDRLDALKKQEDDRKEWVGGGGDSGRDLHYHQADGEAI